jgi:hypothetical protein
MDSIIVTYDNIQHIRDQISQKNTNSVFYGTQDDVYGVITDHDHFPYYRYYRGEPGVDSPIVAEREAGWRPITQTPRVALGKIYPRKSGCFQPACTTTFPCRNGKGPLNHPKQCVHLGQ